MTLSRPRRQSNEIQDEWEAEGYPLVGNVSLMTAFATTSLKSLG